MFLKSRSRVVFAVLVLGAAGAARGEEIVSVKARAILETYCHRCHGKDGNVEGGLNYVMDRDKLVARHKLIPGRPDDSPLFRRVAAGKMPPAGQTPRPSAADIVVLRQWIEAGAPGRASAPPATAVSDSALNDLILADLDRMDRRARRFARYFSLAPLANAGAGPDELQTYRNALTKLLNSLSWHPRISVPRPLPGGLVLAIDLRDYQWNANTWNRLLAEYPYGVAYDTSAARAVLVNTATRVPCLRVDWFVATACRPPLYYDILQIPANSADLERQLRVDVNLDLQQDRVLRAGFNGSGISRNNRILERHDCLNGPYWRTYDFEAVPQNLIDRNLLLPDRRNIFAYPLGPGATDNAFQHAGGEIIWSLPNGLHGYMLVNANNERIDKGPIAIVSDPKRPDRAVEPGVSCMACHWRGINPKDDQLRDHVLKNAKAFARGDREAIIALYPPRERMRAVMEEDAEQFKKAIEKTGNRVTAAEPVMAMTLRHESDVDLPTLAAEAGLRPEELQPRLAASENLAKNLGALKVPGGTVSRQLVVQGWVDLVRELRLGTPFQPGITGAPLPDATGEADPLEAQSSPANAVAFSSDGRLAAFAANDRSVRIWDIEGARDRRRCIGHTASVWCVAFSPDGKQLLSGGKDGTVRLWDVEPGTELYRFEGHTELVSALAFSPDGKRALSAGYDHQVFLWHLSRREPLASFRLAVDVKYPNAVAFLPDGKEAFVCAGRTIYMIDATTGKVQRRLEGHAADVACIACSSDGKYVLSGGDDGALKLWRSSTGELACTCLGHQGPVKSVAFSRTGDRLLSGGTDATVRLWATATGRELKVFRKHAEPVVAVSFAPSGEETLSVSRDGDVRLWRIGKYTAVTTPAGPATMAVPPLRGELRPAAALSVGGTITGLHLSPDRRWLYCLNVTEHQIEKIEAATLRREKELRLPEGTELLVATSEGRTLLAAAPESAHAGHSVLLAINPDKLEVEKSFSIPVEVQNMAAGAEGKIFVSTNNKDRAALAIVDLHKQTIVARWDGVRANAHLAPSSDGKRLYLSSSPEAVGLLEAFELSSRTVPPTSRRAPNGKHALGGEYVPTPDGRFLLGKTGVVLRQSADTALDMDLYAVLPPFTAAAVDPTTGRAFLMTSAALLVAGSYPGLSGQASWRLGLTPMCAVLDAKAGLLYVGGIDAQAAAQRPRARGQGDLHVYIIKDLAVAP